MHVLNHPRKEHLFLCTGFLKNGKIGVWDHTRETYMSCKPLDLVASRVQEGSFYIVDGQVGRAKDSSEGKVVVQLPEDNEVCLLAKEVAVCPIQRHAFVTWTSHDDDVAEGDVGEVYKYVRESGRFNVRFPKGDWDFKARSLRLCGIQPGQYVSWTSAMMTSKRDTSEKWSH